MGTGTTRGADASGAVDQLVVIPERESSAATKQMALVVGL